MTADLKIVLEDITNLTPEKIVEKAPAFAIVFVVIFFLLKDLSMSAILTFGLFLLAYALLRNKDDTGDRKVGRKANK